VYAAAIIAVVLSGSRWQKVAMKILQNGSISKSIIEQEFLIGQGRQICAN
jgi:hypothetical protein